MTITKQHLCSRLTAIFFICALFLTINLHATETENLGIRILPVPKAVVIDGKAADWDLSGGIFACADVEHQRDQIGVWIHLMYDADNLYVLARFLDETPLSNPGLAGSDFPWNGDSLQMRIVADPNRKGDSGKPVVCWANGWRDRAGTDAVDLDFFNKNGEALKDAIAKGARQACQKNPDGKGYVQEMALPWKLLVPGGITPTAGGRMIFSVEPNFNVLTGYRISLKDIFRQGVEIDRVFTFQAVDHWGYATFAPTGKVEPQKLRLSDSREFAVTMQGGVPAVDWAPLFEEKKMEGFAKINLEMPQDGYVSLNIKNAEGRVVRQLLNAAFKSRGKHELLWDGLSNLSHLKPGEVVAAGAYTWEAIYHTGIGQRLVGWADNSGNTPFDTANGSWGGDHGLPTAVTTDGKAMYLGWTLSEAGKGLVCTDLIGNVKWRHTRGAFGGAQQIAVLGDVVYINDNQKSESVIYRLNAKSGKYSNWKGKQVADLKIEPGLEGLDAVDGKLYLSQGEGVRVLDADTGEQVAQFAVEKPGDLEVAKDGSIFLLSGGTRLLQLDAKGGVTPVIEGLHNAKALAIGPDGTFYLGVGEPDNQVKVFSAAGKLLRTIGKQGGRPLLGAWEQDGMRFINALRVDAKGVLWVVEKDDLPKRISCWNTADGSFVREFFGPTAYGATGGAISPDNPMTMVGSGCEWLIDEKTGKSSCVGVFHREGMGNSRFGRGPSGRLYVAVQTHWNRQSPVLIYERLAPGIYKLRTRLESIAGKQAGPNQAEIKPGVRVWADANDDQVEQIAEVKHYDIDLGGWIGSWYLSMTTDLSFYGGAYQIATTGFTACGAPNYDLTKARILPGPTDKSRRGYGGVRGLGTNDGKMMLYTGQYGQKHSDFACYDIDSGKLLWNYPDNYVGLHGGHKAPPAQVGMIRGDYGIVGTAKLPEPLGDIFVLGTDKGEWHILTAAGFYLTKLFENDPFKIRFPAPAIPGAILDSVPPGGGAEDFGGSITMTKDGQLYFQAGKTAYINMKISGLDTVKKLPGGKLMISNNDLALAQGFRDKLAQASVGIKVAAAKKYSVKFTGNLRKDFDTKEPLAFQKTRTDRIEAALAWDDTHIYLGWQVEDATPWVNGAGEPALMYCSGDTVDFQLGTDSKADLKRDQPVLGDLRLSIGNFQGKPTVVVYRPLATQKAARKFFSGVIREGYEMQSVRVLEGVTFEVKVDAKGKRYVVEAAIPLAALGLKPAAGLTLSGDIGATFGNPEGKDTVLRSYWSNQATGLVADEVFELKLEPQNWGRINFE